MKNLLLILPLLTTLLGCAGEDPDDMDELTWQEMDFDQRKAFMASDVLPAMQTAFADYDGERFGSITCATCHGAGAGDGTFSMPSEELFPIDFSDFPTGPGADFMSMVIVPEMAELLNTEPFDSETNEGFGCLGCHPS